MKVRIELHNDTNQAEEVRIGDLHNQQVALIYLAAGCVTVWEGNLFPLVIEGNGYRRAR